MSIKEEKYLVALYSYIPYGPKRTSLLLDYFESAENVWSAGKKELLSLGLSAKIVDGFVDYRDKFSFDDYFKELKDRNIKYLTFFDKNYPKNLRGLSDVPSVLYYMGSIENVSDDAVAIVGTRKATSYGRDVAQKFAQELAEVGITIVSGLALGIDAVAHKACVDVGGITIAVLGCGLDTIYPTSNKFLAERILEKGLILSEYPLGYPALPPNFAYRNRIISGISKAVIVVEGAKKSGTLLTASHAAEQGRQVFAVPGNITSPMSEASHYLIKNGASIAFSARDVIEELDMQFTIEKTKVAKVLPDSSEEKEILNAVESETLHLDEIVRITGMSIETVNAKLTVMELKGLVKSYSSGEYKKIS